MNGETKLIIAKVY